MQGQSQETGHKLRGIDAAMRMQSCLASKILMRNSFARYFHFDLFAGSGVNDQIPNCEPLQGSPIVAASVLQRSGLPHIIVCVERNLEYANKLQAATRIDNNTFVICDDNRNVIPAVSDIIAQHGENPRHAIGSVLIDPNNMSDVDWPIMRRCLSLCPKLDVIVNYPGNAEKRKRYASEKGGRDVSFTTIDMMPQLCQRRHWLIRDAALYGMHQFCLCVGRNIKTGDFANEGFVAWDSERGRQIRSRVSNNKSDHQRAVATMSGQRMLGFM